MPTNPFWIFMIIPLICGAVGWAGSYYYYEWRIRDVKNQRDHFRRQRDAYAKRLGLTHLDGALRHRRERSELPWMRSFGSEASSLGMDPVSREGDR